jgi:hypothetical protein
MIWETIAALMLIFSTLPIWFFVALLWGFIRAAFTFFTYLVAFVDSSPVDWSQIWIIPLTAILQGFASAWSIPSGIWNWAKFEHPWWAVLISLVCFVLLGGSRGGADER